MREIGCGLKTILFFFPHNPYPPRTGAHNRCIELLSGLKEIGCHVIFACSELTSDVPWTKDSVEYFKKEMNIDVEIYGLSSKIIHRSFRKIANIYYFNKYKLLTIINNNTKCFTNRISLYKGITHGLQMWFQVLSRKYKPDILFINYAYFDYLVSDELRIKHKTIIEMHDIVSLNNYLQHMLLKHVGTYKFASGYIPDHILDIQYYKKMSLKYDITEFNVYNKYDVTICISDQEKDLVEKLSPHTEAIYVPITHKTQIIDNSYAGRALFTVGPNPFNTQGYYTFVNKILPIIKSKDNSFRMAVTGNFFCNASPILTDEIDYLGFVDDLISVYMDSRFFVCPVFGGTGKQVKIVDAMAHGLAVVVFEDIVCSSPIVHGYNALVAHNEEEFANHVITLWNNNDLCRKMGNAARDTIDSNYSNNKLISCLNDIVCQ